MLACSNKFKCYPLFSSSLSRTFDPLILILVKMFILTCSQVEMKIIPHKKEKNQQLSLSKTWEKEIKPL